VSRDSKGHADGKIFLDKGESKEELRTYAYEYYSFSMQDKTLEKYNLNKDKSQHQGY
jgi:hypothetical protein